MKTEILEISQKSRVTLRRSGSFSKRIHKNWISRINCNPRNSEENKNIVGKRSWSGNRLNFCLLNKIWSIYLIYRESKRRKNFFSSN